MPKNKNRKNATKDIDELLRDHGLTSIQIKRFYKDSADAVIKSFYATGDLTEADLRLPIPEFKTKINELLKHYEITTVLDHRKSLLKYAEKFLDDKSYDISKFFYATFIEHTLNGLIEIECQRRKFDAKTKNDIIRNIDIHGKLTWLPKILGLKNFNLTHIKTIKKLSDDRNAFIHYKWIADNTETNKSSKDLIFESEFKRIKLAVRYLKLYESNVLYKKSKGKIDNFISGK